MFKKPSFLLSFSTWLSVLVLMWLFVFGIVAFAGVGLWAWIFFFVVALVSSAYVSYEPTRHMSFIPPKESDIVWKSERTKKTTTRTPPEP